MIDSEATALLQSAMPQLGLRWAGFRRNRRQVCKRIRRRLAELGLPDIAAYRARLASTPAEWHVLDGLCRVTISRFYRDAAIWNALVRDHLVPLAARRRPVRAWSAGCGAGEEPFTLSIVWQLGLDDAPPLEILATDLDEHQLQRAALARFPRGSSRELPEAWKAAAFDVQDVRAGEVDDAAAFANDANDANVHLRERFTRLVRFERHDLRAPPPDGPFDIVLCRNLAFSYFDEQRQRDVATKLRSVLHDSGVLLLGLDERLPPDVDGFTLRSESIYVAE